MDDWTNRIWQDLAARGSGPLAMRLVLQPIMSLIFAARDGIRDARQGNPAYFWALLTDPEHRHDRIKEAWKSVGKIFILAVILDVAYQLIVYGRIHPTETLIVATALAIVPYVLLRGPLKRIASHWVHGRPLSRPL